MHLQIMRTTSLAKWRRVTTDWRPRFRDSVMVASSRVETSIPLFTGISTPENETTTMSRKVGNQSPVDAAPHPTRTRPQLRMASCQCLFLFSSTTTIVSTFQSTKKSLRNGAVAVKTTPHIHSSFNEANSSALRCHTVICLMKTERRIKFPNASCNNSLYDVFVMHLSFSIDLQRLFLSGPKSQCRT